MLDIYLSDVLKFVAQEQSIKENDQYFKFEHFSFATQQEMEREFAIQDWENHEWPNIRVTSNKNAEAANYELQVMKELIKQGKEISKKYLAKELAIKSNPILSKLINIFMGAATVPLNRFPYGDYVSRVSVLTKIVCNVDAKVLPMDMKVAFQAVMDYAQMENEIDSCNISNCCTLNPSVVLAMKSLYQRYLTKKIKNVGDVSEQVLYYSRNMYKYKFIDKLLQTARFGNISNAHINNAFFRGLYTFYFANGISKWLANRKHLWKPETIRNSTITTNTFNVDRNFFTTKNSNLAILKLIQYIASYTISKYSCDMSYDDINEFILSLQQIYLCNSKLDLNQVNDILTAPYLAILAITGDVQRTQSTFGKHQLHLCLIGQCLKTIECLGSMKLDEFKTETGYKALIAIIVVILCSLVTLYESIKEIENVLPILCLMYEKAQDAASKSCM